MAALMGSSIVLSTLVGVWLGLKLLGLWRRTGGWPEFYIGSALLAYAGVGQVGMLITRAIPEDQSFVVLMSLATIRVLAFALMTTVY